MYFLRYYQTESINVKSKWWCVGPDHPDDDPDGDNFTECHEHNNQDDCEGEDDAECTWVRLIFFPFAF